MIRPVRKHLSSASMSAVGIPKHIQNTSLYMLDIPNDDYKKVIDFVAQYIKDFRTKSLHEFKGICFMGSNGTGKTLLSCIILKYAYMHRYSCKRLTFADYLRIYTANWGEADISYDVDIDDIKNVEFLVLEEIGKEIDSKVSAPILEDLLRYREDNSLVTIICTNSDTKQLKAKYGESIMSLIAGATTKIVLTGIDFRKEG